MILELQKALLDAASDGIDHRFSNWAKEITGIDWSRNDGYMYQGDFIPTGSVEVPDGHNGLYLTCSTGGSRKYQTSVYRLMKIVNGEIVKTKFCTSSEKRGWALRLRDHVEAALAEMDGKRPNPLAKFSTKDLKDELDRRSST